MAMPLLRSIAQDMASFESLHKSPQIEMTFAKLSTLASHISLCPQKLSHPQCFVQQSLKKMWWDLPNWETWLVKS